MLKMKIFKLISIFLIVMFVGATSSIFACTAQSATQETAAVTEGEANTTQSETNTTQSGEKQTLTLWEWHMSEIPDIVGKLYDDFEKKYNVDLVIETLPFGDLSEKYLLAAESPDSLPDIGEMWAANLVPTFAEKGVLEDLTGYMEKDGMMDYFIDDFLTRYNDQIYSLPVYVGVTAMYYNKTLFEKKGITGTPKDWKELIQTAQKLTDKAAGEYGMILNGGDSELLFMLAPFIAQNGGRIGMVDGKIQINSKETVEALQFVVDLIKSGVVPSYTTTTAVTVKEAFMSGKIGMMPDGAWTIPVINAKNPDFKWGTATLPKGKMDGYGLVTGDTEYGMFSHSKNKDLCWEFLKFMTSEENNYFWVKQGTAITTVKSVAAKQDLRDNEYLKAFYEQIDKGNPLAFYNELPPQLAKSADIFKTEMQSAVLGEKSVQEAMDTVAGEWDALYKQWTADYGEWSR